MNYIFRAKSDVGCSTQLHRDLDRLSNDKNVKVLDNTLVGEGKMILLSCDESVIDQLKSDYTAWNITEQTQDIKPV